MWAEIGVGVRGVCVPHPTTSGAVTIREAASGHWGQAIRGVAVRRTIWQALAMVLFTLAAVNVAYSIVQPFHGTHPSVRSVLAASLPAFILGCAALYPGLRRPRAVAGR